MLADAIVVVHFLIVLFVLAGVPLVYLGVVVHWAWVRRWHWRLLHLSAILFIAAESLLGIACPLTVWEYGPARPAIHSRLRRALGSTGSCSTTHRRGCYRRLRRVCRARPRHLDRSATDWGKGHDG